MQTPDPEIQFGPITERVENETASSLTQEDSVVEPHLIAGGDASTPAPSDLRKEREEIMKMRQENEELRRELEAMKLQDSARSASCTPMMPKIADRVEVREEMRHGSQLGEKPRVRPATFDGSGSWTDYKVQFELVAELNGWGELAKAVYLAASLRGSAQAVLGDLDDERRRNYSSLTAALGQRFGPENQTELFRVQLKNRLRRRDETLPELAQAIRRLARQAYPSANYQLQETLAKEHFIDALNDTDMRWRVFQSRPTSLEDAVRVAVELEAFQVADRQRNGIRKPTARMINADDGQRSRLENDESLQGQITALTANIEKILANGFKNLQNQLGAVKRIQPDQNTRVPAQRWREGRESRQPVIECWNCKEVGHISRECTRPRRGTSCGLNNGEFRQGNGLESSSRAQTRLENQGPRRTNQQQGRDH